MKHHEKIGADHIWSAIRGLGLMQKDDAALSRIRDQHTPSEMFASRAIVLAVDQVRALRSITSKGKVA